MRVFGFLFLQPFVWMVHLVLFVPNNQGVGLRLVFF
jgi:hypothetical protein